MQLKKSSGALTLHNRLVTPVEVRIADMMFLRDHKTRHTLDDAYARPCLSVFVRVRPVHKTRHILAGATQKYRCELRVKSTKHAIFWLAPPLKRTKQQHIVAQ